MCFNQRKGIVDYAPTVSILTLRNAQTKTKQQPVLHLYSTARNLDPVLSSSLNSVYLFR